MLIPLLFAATAAAIDGEAALRHASRLAALGPHPWGSALSRGAAQYVAAELERAGLPGVKLEEFERAGVRGVNVVGVRAARERDLVVIGAHHDTAPGAPGAYDDGGGVGILIEVARAMAKAPRSGRTILFVSFDGEEGWAQGAELAGSRAFVEALGPRARDVAAMIALEMSGWKKGTPAIHAIPYADPLRPGSSVVTPAWLAQAALGGARRHVPETVIGDPWISWLYQPTVRAFKVRLYGDDKAFAERGVPAFMVADSSFSAFYPWYHSPEDTADKLDAEALARMGNAVLGMVQALEAADPEPAETDWFSAFGRVLGRQALLVIGFLSLLPALAAARRAGAVRLLLRVLAAAAFSVLLWRVPVPALWSFGLANLLAPWGSRRFVRVAALLPLFAMLLLAAAAWWRGMISGVWLLGWELGLAGVTALLALGALAGGASAKPARAGGGRRAGLPKKRHR